MIKYINALNTWFIMATQPLSKSAILKEASFCMPVGFLKTQSMGGFAVMGLEAGERWGRR